MQPDLHDGEQPFEGFDLVSLVSGDSKAVPVHNN
jgi:hypothetical protein